MSRDTKIKQLEMLQKSISMGNGQASPYMIDVIDESLRLQEELLKGEPMGVGPNYRKNNPYTHSEHSVQMMRSSYQAEIEKLKEQIAKNPDPSEYDVLAVVAKGKYVCLKLRYPNCTNYKGIKILVVKATMAELLTRKELDPHFQEDGFVIARFKPTDDGWNHALFFAGNL